MKIEEGRSKKIFFTISEDLQRNGTVSNKIIFFLIKL